MAIAVILHSGGIKSAVAAARLAADHELILAHVHYGQPAARAQVKAIQALLPTYPQAHYLEMLMPHMVELQLAYERVGQVRSDQRTEGPAARDLTPTAAHDREKTKESVAQLTPASLRGLWPVLCAVGAQCAMRFGAAKVVTGLLEQGPGMHLGLPVTGVSAQYRRELLHAINIAFQVLGPAGHAVQFDAPLMGLDYPDIIRLAERLAVPLAKTRTCEHGGASPCGQCEPCRTRRGAFEQAMMIDPARSRTPRLTETG